MMDTFYDGVLKHQSFDALTLPETYQPLPDDWFIGMADIVGSTAHIEAGRYKLINTVGAAVISTQINGSEGQSFPFIFGGDGSAFAFPLSHRTQAEDGMAAVRRWALEEFSLELRAATVTVKEIRAAGFDVSVARFAASPGADYASFQGGGMAWLEAEMKQGRFDVPIAPVGTLPDLEGLSCRWTPMKPVHGKILSLVVLPEKHADPIHVNSLMQEVVSLTGSLDRGGHPVPVEGPGYSWPPAGLDLEARASHGNSSLFLRRLRLLFDTWIAWVFFRTGLKAGGFDPDHYVRTTGRNADFRKFEDGLKMTIDCDDATQLRLQKLLQASVDEGHIVFGLYEQDTAVMTCIVPSITSDDHIHFVDGGAGGYATAAAQIKNSATG